MPKHSLSVAGHRTSITLEDEFWAALGAIAAQKNQAVSALVAEIDATKPDDANLSSAIRIFILRHYQANAGI